MEQMIECIKMSSSNSLQISVWHLPDLNWKLLFKVFLSSILFLQISSPLAIAQISQLEIGDRVRITAPYVEQNKIKGTVQEIDQSVLVLAVKDTSFYISESMIHNLETSTGKKRVAGRGLIIGAVTGTMLTGLASAFANSACGPGDECVLANSDGEAFLAGATMGLLIGAVIGTATGFFTKIDEWERVPFGVAVESKSVPVDINKNQLSPSLTFRLEFGR